MKFKDEEDLKAYVEAAPHREYQAATAEQTAGGQFIHPTKKGEKSLHMK